MNLTEKAAQANDQELNEMLNSDSFLQRASSLYEFGSRIQDNFDKQKLESLRAAIEESRNRSTTIRGTITVAHVGMLALAKIEDTRVKKAFQSLLKDWEETDRSDLLWFLESEGVDISEYQPILQAA